MIFPEQPEVIQRKLDTLNEQLTSIHSEYELLNAENEFFEQFGALFSKFKQEFVGRLKKRVADESIRLPNTPDTALARERLAGKYEQLDELQAHENGAAIALKAKLLEKARVLNEITRLNKDLKQQLEKRERKITHG
jgi:DNA segregation ATPase FtsK/SpoIIIE-like protein